MPRLRNSTVVITGASSGIGRAAAFAFARRGARLVLAARREAPLREAAEQGRALGAADAIAVPADVTDAEAVRRLARAAAQAFGAIDVWVNNAGAGLFGPYWTAPIEAHRRVVEINLFGAMHGAHAVLPYFLAQGHGVLINNISIGAWVAPPFAEAYAASKFGLRGFTESLRQGLLDWPDIHVCGLYPSFIDTPGFQHGANYSGRTLKPGPLVYPPERVAEAMVSLAEHPRPALAVGAPAPLARMAHAVAPHLVERVMTRGIQRSLDRAAPAPVTDGALFAPVPEGTGTGGGWRKGQDSAWRMPLLVAGAAVAATLAVAGRRRGRDEGVRLPVRGSRHSASAL